jgi:hypothetical protein
VPPELQHVRLLLVQVVWPTGLLSVMLRGCLGIGRSETEFGCAARRLAAGRPAGEALALAGRKIGLVDKPMLAKRPSLELGLDFLGAIFWMGFLLPRLVILLIGLLFPPREFLVKAACSLCPT